MSNQAEVQAAIEVVVLMGRMIREKKEIPNGELYAMVMGKMTLETYGLVINTLKKAGAITEENHLLKWVGK